MRRHGLLLERRPRHAPSTRRHDGKVAVDRSNVRWCSDGFEFRCDDGAPLRVVFALDHRVTPRLFKRGQRSTVLATLMGAIQNYCP